MSHLGGCWGRDMLPLKTGIPAVGWAGEAPQRAAGMFEGTFEWQNGVQAAGGGS